MLMPSIFGENLFDDFFGDFPFYYDDRAMKDAEKKLYGHKANHVMKTDIKEMSNGYELIVDLPGFKKDEIHAALENGYLTISAEKGLDKDEQEKETGRYIRRERYAGACSRSFYVGKEVHQDDIKAEFKHGILTLFVPKKEAKPAVEQKHSISIEGYSTLSYSNGRSNLLASRCLHNEDCRNMKSGMIALECVYEGR